MTVATATHVAGGCRCCAMVGTLKAVGFKHRRWLGTVLTQRRLGGDDPTA